MDQLFCTFYDVYWLHELRGKDLAPMLLSSLTPDTSAFRLCILLIVKKDKNVKVVHQVEKLLFVFIEVKNGSVAALVIPFVVIAASVIVLWLGALFLLFVLLYS